MRVYLYFNGCIKPLQRDNDKNFHAIQETAKQLQVLSFSNAPPPNMNMQEDFCGLGGGIETGL